MDQSSIADLLAHPKVQETLQHMHHSVPKHDHLMRSVRFSYRLAPVLRADRNVCMRAAILHDIDSRYGTLTTHGAIAARWAATQGESEAVCRAIVSHMFPFGPLPTTREGWVLAMADKMASLSDLTHFVGGLLTGRSQEVRRRLRTSDPFYPQQRQPLLKRLLPRSRQRHLRA